MIVAALLCAVLVAAGVYYCLVAVFQLPIRKKAIKSADTKRSKTKALDVTLLHISKKVAPFIRLNKLKRAKLARALEATKSTLTAEEYSANVLTSTAVLVLLGLVALLVNVYIGAGVFIYVYHTYKEQSKKVFQDYYRKRDEIEGELPRFVSFIEQKLAMQDTNVLSILEEYKLTDNLAFVSELEHTLADMNTSSFENGLLRFNQRISSEQLTMVIRGLLGLIRGEEQSVYFKMLKNDMSKLEINELKRNSSKRQKKISRYSAMLLTALMITIVTPLLIVIVESFSKLFG